MAREVPKPGERPTHDEIQRRAYEIFVQNGRRSGHDIENWLEAEAQLKGRKAEQPAKPRAQIGMRQSGRT